MLGLRTQENEKHKRFFEIVQNAAAKQGCVFFSTCGTGENMVIDDQYDCEDLEGYLVPKEKAEEFQDYFLQYKENDKKWADNFVTMEWKRSPEGDFVITFDDFHFSLAE